MKAPWSQEHTDLLAMVVPHMAVIGEDERKHYLRTDNRDQIPVALKRGFVLPSAIVSSAVPVALEGYPIEETDCHIWLGHMQQFAEKYFGTKAKIGDIFDLPLRVPWKNCLPILDPGLTDREMIDKALKARSITVYEEKDVMKFTGAGASPRPQLHIIQRSLTPTEAGMGLPPRFHQKWFAGRQTRPLHRRAYGIATSLHHAIEKQFLDPQTFTWFTENRLSDGNVAYGDWFGGSVGFSWNDPDDEGDGGGFREAIEVPLKPQILVS